MTDTTLSYLAIGNHSWGIGETAKEAKKNARRYEARTRLSVYKLPEGVSRCRVDELGRVYWDGEPGTKLTHVAGPKRLKGAL